MTVRIVLDGASGVTAGVRFEDGVAVVNELSPNARTFLELVGATITEEAALASDPYADLRVGDKLLTDCTIAELRDLAQTEGLTVPPKASKEDILALFLDAFTKED